MIDYMSSYAMIEEPGKDPRSLTLEEKNDAIKIPTKFRLLQRAQFTSAGWSKTRSFDYEWNNETYRCPVNQHWRVSKEGIDHMAEIDRLVVSTSEKGGKTLRWKQ